MKKYMLPKMEIARFTGADILTASGIEPSEQSLTPGAPNAAGKDILSDTVQKYEISYFDMSK